MSGHGKRNKTWVFLEDQGLSSLYYSVCVCVVVFVL